MFLTLDYPTSHPLAEEMFLLQGVELRGNTMPPRSASHPEGCQPLTRTGLPLCRLAEEAHFLLCSAPGQFTGTGSARLVSCLFVY